MHSPLHIWITGASKGIGLAVAELAAPEFYVTISNRSGKVPESLAGASNVFTTMCDVRDEKSVADAHTAAVAKYGAVNVLINNAGIGVFENLTDLSVADFDSQIATNLRGVFLCVKNVLPAMLAHKDGMIITLNSIATTKAFSGCTGYAASKAGVLALTRSLREEVRADGVRVVDMIVGATATDIWSAEHLTTHADQMMNPSDIAESVMNIISQYHHPRLLTEEILLRPLLGDL
ncbi:MAG: SDR family NAD(P)-dependent oxidoreductase [Ignavibacteria bacterium]|nr:SDR family NAD(P)-dependent oxidoreductase [Ignavibacteria bacterium]